MGAPFCIVPGGPGGDMLPRFCGPRRYPGGEGAGRRSVRLGDAVVRLGDTLVRLGDTVVQDVELLADESLLILG